MLIFLLVFYRAEFDAAKVTARTGAKDGLPRAMLAHATMRRLKLAVGEKILVVGTQSGAHRKVEVGQAVGENGEGDEVAAEVAPHPFPCCSGVVRAPRD